MSTEKTMHFPEKRMITSYLKRNSVFFTIIFVLWLVIMYSLYAHHPYFPEPKPNELQQMQAQQQSQHTQQNANPNLQHN